MTQATPERGPKIEIFPPPQFYLAAPFFNEAQIEIVSRIENMMRMHGVPLFSPRQTPENKKPKLTDEDAAEIFRNNIKGILDCQAVLAVMDWAMPEGQHLFVCEGRGDVTVTSPPLNIPDVGTVFEMGYAFGRRPIYGFTLRKKGEKVNLMLTQCLEGVIYGWDDLISFLNKGRIRPAFAVKGVWNHR